MCCFPLYCQAHVARQVEPTADKAAQFVLLGTVIRAEVAPAQLLEQVGVIVGEEQKESVWSQLPFPAEYVLLELYLFSAVQLKLIPAPCSGWCRRCLHRPNN